MTFIEIIDLFTYYGVDVAVLGIITCALTQILKTTILKKAPNKVYAFLPVVIGTVLYFAYALLTHLSFEYAIANATLILDKGFTVGCAATLIYVVCEQFMKGGIPSTPAQNVVAAMIADFVDGEKLDEVSKKIADEFDVADLRSAAQRIENTLCESCTGDAAAKELNTVALLIAGMLAQIKKVTP